MFQILDKLESMVANFSLIGSGMNKHSFFTGDRDNKSFDKI